MAAYAAVVSLLNTMDQIHSHPRISFAFDQKQIESLGEKVDFLLDFIEADSHGVSQLEAQVHLESLIKSAANVAEDVIESHVVDHIQAAGSIPVLDLQEIMEEMDSIKEMVIKFKQEKMGSNNLQQSMPIATSSRPSITTEKNTMIGVDEELIQLTNMLTMHQSNRQIISIVGMGGIGKTVLAKNVYENLLIVRHFDIRAWVTVSQVYSVKEIRSQLLSCQGESTTDTETEEHLGKKVRKSLSDRRYLIVLDDVLSIEALEEIQLCCPDNNNGSRILVTTRLSNMAFYFGSFRVTLNLLDEDKSWNLFCEKAFGGEICPPELVAIGKDIAKSCRGLPLSISVIGGLLGKSFMTQEYWAHVAKNINSFLNSGEDAQCLDILSLSYNHLPVHLKSCFLYMGIFPKDHEIRVSRLIKLWVAEGLLKPNKSQSLEEIAEDYLKDLINRNLVLIRKVGSSGNIKTCIIHDVMRDFCLRIAKKEKFLCVMRRGIENERHIVLHERIPDKYDEPEFFDGSESLARSLICEGGSIMGQKFRLLRVLNEVDENSLEGIFKLVNLRYVACIPNYMWSTSFKLSSLSISLLWNVQTLVLRYSRPEDLVAPSQIWRMPQLRHVESDRICLPDPPSTDPQDEFIGLRNLQTLKGVVNLRLSEEVCKRIPNIKKLHLYYNQVSDAKPAGYYCFHNVTRLHKLESLNCCFCNIQNLRSLAFPSSLKKLCLSNIEIDWEDMTIIGSMPHLEVLKLNYISKCGHEWNPVEGGFLRLKFLKIARGCNLRYWNAESSHFPVLEKLLLEYMYELDEIPSDIGEITALQLIHLHVCSKSVIISAMKILEEQESFGNEQLQVRVQFWNRSLLESFKEEVGLENLPNRNFQLG